VKQKQKLGFTGQAGFTGLTPVEHPEGCPVQRGRPQWNTLHCHFV